MYVTSLVLEAPDQISSTRLARDEAAAMDLLRELFPDLVGLVKDEDLVHHLERWGVRARVQRHDLAQMMAPEVLPASPFGDLYRVGDAYTLAGDPRRGGFLRPATPMEAAISRSSARLDGGLGVFGVRARKALAVEGRPDITATEFLHIGSDAWDHALTGPSVRYFRVENIPAGATLPDIPAGVLNPIA